MTLAHVATFLAGFSAGLLFAAIAWHRDSSKRRRWRDRPPFITEE